MLEVNEEKCVGCGQCQPFCPEDLPHVFDRFYLGRQRRPGSTGLGLAIARATIEAHGGQITIESTVGSGTTVTIVLPLAVEQS